MTKSDSPGAVVRVGGHQYKVCVGDTIVVDRVAAEEGKSLTLETLALLDAGGASSDAAERAKVEATVSEHLLGEKIKVFTYKPKSTFKKTKGHRSRLSKLTIDSITLKESKEKQGGA